MPAPALPTGPRRPTCPRCERPLSTCLCAWVRPTANQVPLLVLQHPLEAKQAKGSARLLRLSLTQCQLEVGEHFPADALNDWITPGCGQAPVWLLYPDPPRPAAEQAVRGGPPAPSAIGPLAPPCRLLLLDGTWRQARQLLRLNPALQALPRWALPAPPPSRYAIRKAHRPQQRSTLEAACLALAALEGRPDAYAPLLAAFDHWVASLAARAALGRPPPLTAV